MIFIGIPKARDTKGNYSKEIAAVACKLSVTESLLKLVLQKNRDNLSVLTSLFRQK